MSTGQARPDTAYARFIREIRSDQVRSGKIGKFCGRASIIANRANLLGLSLRECVGQ